MYTASCNNAPDEIMFCIFQDLTEQDLAQCQKVCRSWYIPAHLLLLKELHLKNNEDVDKFLTDNNSLYRDAVKELILGSHDDEETISADRLKLLFSSKLCIEKLSIHGEVMLSAIIDPDIRELVQQSCVRLKSVYCPADNINTTELLVALNATVTNVDLKPGSDHSFLSSLTHLKELDVSENRNYGNWQSWLPLYEQPYTLDVLHGTFSSGDQDNFADLVGNKQQVMEKVAKLKALCIEGDQQFCPNTTQFVARYLTGLDTFNTYITLRANKWTDAQYTSFNTDFVDIASRVLSSNIDLPSIYLPNCIKSVFQKVLFQQTIPNTNIQCIERTLKLSYNNNNSNDLLQYLDDDDDEDDEQEADTNTYSVMIKSSKINRQQINRFVEILLTDTTDPVFETVIPALAGTDDNITHLHYNIKKGDRPEGYFEAFQETLALLSSVEKVTLSLPAGDKVHKEIDTDNYYDKVQYLELNARGDMTNHKLMNGCLSMFAEIRFLKLYYFSGVWDQDKTTYSVPLEDLSLERLYLDISPVFLKSQEQDCSYFQLDIIVENKKTRSFHVYLDYLRVMEDDEAIEKDGVRVVINVEKLEFVNLYLFKDAKTSFFKDSYMYACKEELVEAKLDLRCT